MSKTLHNEKKSLLWKVLPTTVMGNALEFFDFTIYAIFATTIGKLFFPLDNPTASLLASWGTFAVGFLMRPMGGLVFGYLGDRFGRKISLSGTVLLTGFPTLIIGILPGYEQIGLMAPITLILCRMLQGLCTGGEYNGAAIFALEHFRNLKPGTVGGVITGSCVIGALLATFSGYLINTYGTQEMWRLPFIFGAFISILGFIIRFFISETPEFMALQESPQKKNHSIFSIYQQYGASSLMSFMTGCFNGSLSYTLFGFLNVYMSKYLGLEPGIAMKYNLLGLFFFMTFSPIAGYYLDCFGSEKAMQMAGKLVLIGALPIFYLLQTLNPVMILIGQAALGILVAAAAGTSHGFLQKLFPVEMRYRGISINFCAGMALCGGTAPMILTYFIEAKGYSFYMPAFYLMLISTLFLICHIALSKKIGLHRDMVSNLTPSEVF